jgi:hypothetical protein
VRFRLARGSDVPSSGIPPHSGARRPLERGPVSIESRAPPRASFRLVRGHHGPAASIPAPPVGAFNALTFAGARVKGESTPLRTWESRPGTTPPTPLARSSSPLCNAVRRVSNNPVARCHPLLYGRRAAPSKKDGRALEGKTSNYSAPAQDCAVTSSQWGRSPPSPSALCDHPCHRDAFPATAPTSPTLWERAVTGRRHAGYCASYGLTSMMPSSPHTDDHRTGDPYAATLEAAPGHTQDTP